MEALGIFAIILATCLIMSFIVCLAVDSYPNKGYARIVHVMLFTSLVLFVAKVGCILIVIFTELF